MKNRRPGLSKASTKWNAWGMLLLVIWLTGWTGFGIAQEKKTGPEPLASVLPIPQPQFFCGSCHILTYPEIIKEQTALWKNSRHNQVGCVKCHYAPEKSPRAGSETAAKHLPIQPPEHFTHLKLGGPIVQTRPRIDDATCMSADCHGKAGDDFKTRKIKFTAKVNFVHEPHFAAANQVGGLKPGCTTCHQHETNQKKFEVTPTTCFLCHFMGTKLNDGKGR
ncbi:MAG: hypothetical protein Q8P24_05995, partial [Desulfobacterales bacterium]|nr:hypothetical protein [Desulfobacterales bacterium]